MKNFSELIQQLRDELLHLEDANYRQEQHVRLGNKELKNIRRNIEGCVGGNMSNVSNLCRLISDCAPINSRISRLVEQFYIDAGKTR